MRACGARRASLASDEPVRQALWLSCTTALATSCLSLPSSALGAGGARSAALPCVGDGAGKQASSCIVVRQRRHAGADVMVPAAAQQGCVRHNVCKLLFLDAERAPAPTRVCSHTQMTAGRSRGRSAARNLGRRAGACAYARLLARADDGWETVGKKRSTSKVDGKQVSSAFLGEYTPVPAGAPPPPRPPPAAAPPPPPPAAPAPAPEPAAPAAPKCGPCLAAGLEQGSFLLLFGAAQVVREHHGL